MFRMKAVLATITIEDRSHDPMMETSTLQVQTTKHEKRANVKRSTFIIIDTCFKPEHFLFLLNNLITFQWGY
jgi:hypothetical protein